MIKCIPNASSRQQLHLMSRLILSYIRSIPSTSWDAIRACWIGAWVIYVLLVWSGTCANPITQTPNHNHPSQG